ncbi:hypothetical protein [Actinocorallia sp. A-T 12471]|uniref:hypothetical protein n=1 Tax=Actinocorallia sp. A-T 12471 TaxID=3089813 RepID=UPI0029D1105D|nr:hypothetical protein [Actinocorallia sp. A-T 12471]MDX6743599.1 hypothetical protein [Actinocorallia sp. A-T 12471]
MSTTSGKKPVRRVRVIEIVDEDGTELDEETVKAVLAAADAEDAGERAAVALDKPEKSDESEKSAKAEADEASAKDAESVEEAESGESVAKDGDGGPRNVEPGRAWGLGGVTAVRVLAAAVAVLAVLAAFGLYGWRSAASAAAERDALVARIAAFGDVMATFSYTDVAEGNDRTLAFLTGDAKAEREQLDLAAFGERLTAQKADLKSKTHAVYVGQIDGSLASAVLVFDLSIEAPALSQSQTISRSHLTLGLIKVDGTWMISSMVPAGSESDTGSAVPGVEGPATEPAAPTPSGTASPKDGE